MKSALARLELPAMRTVDVDDGGWDDYGTPRPKGAYNRFRKATSRSWENQTLEQVLQKNEALAKEVARLRSEISKVKGFASSSRAKLLLLPSISTRNAQTQTEKIEQTPPSTPIPRTPPVIEQRSRDSPASSELDRVPQRLFGSPSRNKVRLISPQVYTTPNIIHRGRSRNRGHDKFLKDEHVQILEMERDSTDRVPTGGLNTPERVKSPIDKRHVHQRRGKRLPTPFHRASGTATRPARPSSRRHSDTRRSISPIPQDKDLSLLGTNIDMSVSDMSRTENHMEDPTLDPLYPLSFDQSPLDAYRDALELSLEQSLELDFSSSSGSPRSVLGTCESTESSSSSEASSEASTDSSLTIVKDRSSERSSSSYDASTDRSTNNAIMDSSLSSFDYSYDHSRGDLDVDEGFQGDPMSLTIRSDISFLGLDSDNDETVLVDIADIYGTEGTDGRGQGHVPSADEEEEMRIKALDLTELEIQVSISPGLKRSRRRSSLHGAGDSLQNLFSSCNKM